MFLFTQEQDERSRSVQRGDGTCGFLVARLKSREKNQIGGKSASRAKLSPPPRLWISATEAVKWNLRDHLVLPK